MFGFLKKVAKKWLKVSQLKVGAKIAVPRAAAMAGYGGLVANDSLLEEGEGDYMWDEITEIKKVGRERVYDIEVDGTHNFIAGNINNKLFGGIFAHNTYVTGNVGIGTTTPTYRLQLPNVGDATGQGQANAWVAYSDRSLKEEVDPITNALNNVLLLQGVDFTWKGQGIRSSGFIAQDVEEVIPSLVSTDINGIKSLDYGRFTPYLVEAIKTQQLNITTNTSRLDLLDQKIMEEASGSLILNATGNSIQAKDLLDATLQGVATKVKSGTISDTDFILPINGLMAVDSANGRVYFRYDNDWHYVNQTGGFQIPNYETAPYEKLSQNSKIKENEALPFESSNYPHYITEKLTPGELLIPFVDEYLPDGAVHGLYARFEDVKEKMFTQEKSQLVDLALKTAENIETIKEFKESVDKNLAVISSNFESLDNNIDRNEKNVESLETRTEATEAKNNDLSSRVSVLEFSLSESQLAGERLEFLTQILNPAEDGSLTIYNDLNLEGRLSAEEVVLNKITIKTDSEETRTVGQAVIVGLAKDEDADGKDDNTGADGKSVIIKTRMVTESSKIFLTFENNPQSLYWAEKVTNESGALIGFKILLNSPASADIKVSWWILEEDDPAKQTTSTPVIPSSQSEAL
jgi:hypothetical protein